MNEKTGLKRSNGNGCPLTKPLSPIAFFSEVALTMERARVAAQVRLSHLEHKGRKDDETKELFKRVRALEDFVDDWLKQHVDSHPTAPWLKGISGCVSKKGILSEPICKFIGLVDSFGCYYPQGDTWIPLYVNRQSEIDEEKNAWVWVEGIERLATPSKLFRYAALDPEAKREKGKLSTGNTKLKTILFRCMTLFMYQKNKYYDLYLIYKDWKRQKLQQEGIKVCPTPAGRYCFVCEQEVKTKAGFYCPTCGEKLAKKEELAGVIWEGHLDFMARRRAIKLFLSHWWAVYRQALGLPLRVPYPVEFLGHETIIDPWQMCDKKD